MSEWAAHIFINFTIFLPLFLFYLSHESTDARKIAPAVACVPGGKR